MRLIAPAQLIVPCRLSVPWGYTTDKCDDYDDLYNLGLEATKKVEQTHGTHWRVSSLLISTKGKLIVDSTGKLADCWS